MTGGSLLDLKKEGKIRMEPISNNEAALQNELANRYLAERGISDSTVKKYGIEIDISPIPERFRDRLGFNALSEGKLAELAKEVIWFPCRDADGTMVSWIARLLPAPGEAKFLTPTAVAPFPFIPPQTWAAGEKSSKTIIITEGPVKALAICQIDQLPIGLGGAWMATQKGADGTIELVPTLKAFKWFGRIVYLAFDADWTTNPSVRQAMFRTFFALYRQGAKVRFLSWPLSEGKGIDDYLHTKIETCESAIKRLAILIETAGEIGKLIEPEDLRILQSELSVACLSSAQLSQISRILAEPLKVRASALEADAADEEAETVGRTFTLTDPEPWPEPVEGVDLIGETIGLLRRYVVMTESDATAVALWISLTYLDQHVDTLPILAVTSPEKRCGKTTLLTIISKLARKALSVANISPAALFRAIEKLGPSLVIDEGDTFLRDNEELRGILNAGHTREFAFVVRSNHDSLEPERFSTWAPKAIACIGKLPETLGDRSVEIRLQRRTHKETAEKLRDADPEIFTRLQRMAFRWALDNGDKVKRARPAIPQALNDRACDNWHPLLAIATVAGFGGVPNMAIRLSVDQSDQESIKVMVLTAVRDLFKEAGDGFQPTDVIIERLNQDKEAPWAGWKNGMTAEKLGKILKSYSVKSEQRQESGERRRGYLLKILQPVFDRYLAPVPFLTVENGPQPVHLPVDQVLEPFRDCTGSKINPCSAQDDNSTRAPADQVLEPIREETHRLKPKIAFGKLNGSTPSHDYDDDSDEETILSPENGYGTTRRLAG